MKPKRRLFPRVKPPKPGPQPPTAENVKRILMAAATPDPRPYLAGIIEDAQRQAAREIEHAARRTLAEIDANRAAVAVAYALELARLLRDDLLTRDFARHRSIEELASIGLGKDLNCEVARDSRAARNAARIDARRKRLPAIWAELKGKDSSENWRLDQARAQLTDDRGTPSRKTIREDLYLLGLKKRRAGPNK